MSSGNYLRDILYATLIYEDRYQFLLKGLANTLILTFFSFLLGTLFGSLFTLANLRGGKVLRKLIQVLTQFLVRIPSLVLLMVLFYIVFADVSLSGVILAIFAFTLKSAAYMSDIFTSAILSLNAGEVEAARSLGLSKLKAFLNITLPQAVQVALPVYKNQFITTLQETSIVGFLAIQDLTRASNILASRTLDPFVSLMIISIAYLLIGWVANRLLSILERSRHIGPTEVTV